MNTKESQCFEGIYQEPTVIETLQQQLDWRLQQVTDLNNAIKQIKHGDVNEKTLRTVMDLGIRR